MSYNSRKFENQTRLLGNTEQNWCKAVAGGTGITTLALQVSKEPNISLFQKAIQKIQDNHPILNVIIQKNTHGSTSFVIIPTNPDHFRFNILSLSKTSDLLQTLMSRGSNPNPCLSPLHVLLEHELNINEWSGVDNSSLCMEGMYVWFANGYTLVDHQWVVVFRFHTAVCDRTTAVSFLKELKEVMGEEGGGCKEEVNMGIEDRIPIGKAKKTMWAHGKDMLTYSVNSLRLTNLKFKDAKSTRRSEVVRLKMNAHETQTLLAGCKLRGIKLCGALAAATILAAYSSKRNPNNYKRKKYGVIFLNDCRSFLQPPLSSQNFGFYHSAISTLHEVKGGETLWDLATRTYMAFANSKNSNKHFSDMADLNFLMCKAIENPSLTPSSSLRTSLVTVFEDPVIETSSETERKLGLDDYIGCASAHGVGPSIALFDTVRDGHLDCACVYPSPLHSREQMQELLANMKIILVDGIKLAEKLET